MWIFWYIYIICIIQVVSYRWWNSNEKQSIFCLLHCPVVSSPTKKKHLDMYCLYRYDFVDYDPICEKRTTNKTTGQEGNSDIITVYAGPVKFRNWLSLCAQVSNHLMGLDHQQTKCWVQRSVALSFKSLGIIRVSFITLQWPHNEHDCVSNHQPHDCLLNRLFRRRSKKTSKLRVTGLNAGNSPVTGEFPAQMASNADFFSIWWRHHDGQRDQTRSSDTL